MPDEEGIQVEVEEDVHKNANLQNEAPLMFQQFYQTSQYTLINHLYYIN